ncbi:hypothetical protein BU15DRAFT_62123 [Melanogaster broomeanus]|nr:hypothetical protein BU15DRAFT_62123 [Melanogaster broomeanus]
MLVDVMHRSPTRCKLEIRGGEADTITTPETTTNSPVDRAGEGTHRHGRMSIGMGLCGTRVQIRHDGESEKYPRENSWYIEDLVASFPSLYTEFEVKPSLKLTNLF